MIYVILTIKIWDIENGICVITLVGNSQIVISIRLGRHNTLISSSIDGTIKVWNLETGIFIFIQWRVMEEEVLEWF